MVRDRLQLHQEFRTALAALHAQRHRTEGTAWIEIEQRGMLAEVNRVRRLRGRPAATLEEVQRVETGALGHSDYASKFAWYCVELALEQTSTP